MKEFFIFLVVLLILVIAAFLLGYTHTEWTYNREIGERGMPMLRTITAYTLGRVEETDNTPCFGPNPRIDLCTLVSKGYTVFATRVYPQGSWLKVGNQVGIVLDKTSRKFSDRIDIAKLNRQEALDFGVKNLVVEVISYPLEGGIE